MNLNVLLEPLALVLLFVLVVVFPMLGVRDYRRLVRWTQGQLPDARLRHYRQLMAGEWITVAVFLAWWFGTGRAAAPLGLIPGLSGWQWLAVAVGLAFSVSLTVQMLAVTRNPGALSAMRRQIGELEYMVPRNARELRAFYLLSLTAGICEEILYRGVLLAVLAPAIGTWPAVVASSVVFGLAHVYQGVVGSLKTVAVGLVFAVLTVFSGSLFTAIVVHIVMDVTSGRIMSAALQSVPDAAGCASTDPGQSA